MKLYDAIFFVKLSFTTDFEIVNKYGVALIPKVLIIELFICTLDHTENNREIALKNHEIQLPFLKTCSQIAN